MSSLTTRGRGTRVVAGLLALGLVGGLALQACGSDSSSSSSDTTSADGSTTTTVVNTTSLDEVKVEGEFGSKPTVTFDPSYVGDERHGEGDLDRRPGRSSRPTSSSRSTSSASAVSTAPSSRRNFGVDQPAPAVTLDSSEVLPVLAQAMVGQPVGTRVMLAATDKAGRPRARGPSSSSTSSAATIPLSGPTGEDVAPPAGLPTVTVENGVPSPHHARGRRPHDARRAAAHQG